MARLAIHHEILREQLQNHAVRFQLHMQGAVHHAVHVALIDLPQVSEFHQAAAVGAFRGLAAHPHHHRIHGNSGIGLGFAQRREVVACLHGRGSFRRLVDGCGVRLPPLSFLSSPVADGESTLAFSPCSQQLVLRYRTSARLADSLRAAPCAGRRRS